MFDGFTEALSLIGRWDVLLLVVGATILGTLASLIPGLSSAKMLALAIPFTYTMETLPAMGFMSALLAAGGFAGALTSILIGVPGDGISAATVLDGYPMAKQGRAGEAIGATAAASALGALVGVVLVIAMIPFIRPLALMFGPPEIAVLSIAAISLVAITAGTHPVKGLIAGVTGMLIGLVGLNFTVGEVRYTFGIRTLEDGVRLVPLLLAVFGVPAIVELFRYNTKISRVPTSWEGDSWKGVRAVLKRWRLLIRSSLGGTAIGLLPGVGGSIATWAAYFDAVRRSDEPETFGTGNIDGVIAPEASNDAKDAGQLLTFLALGVPTGVGTAIMLGAFQVHGIFPGPGLFERHMDLIWVMIIALIIANVLTSVWGLMFVRWIVKLTEIPPSIMVALVAIISIVGSYADLKQFTGIVTLVIFGIVGTIMQRYGYGAAPFLVGLIMLPIAEKNYFLSMQINRGSHAWLVKPTVLVIIAIAFLVIVGVPLIRKRSQNRKAQILETTSSVDLAPETLEMMAQDDVEESEFDDDVEVQPISGRALSAGELALVLCIAAVGIAAFILSLDFRPGAEVVPRIVVVMLLALVVWRLREGWLARGEPRRAEDEDEKPVRSYPYIAAWLFLLPLLVWSMGMLPGSLVYVVALPLFGLRDNRAIWKKLRDMVLLGALIYFLLGYVMPYQLGVRFPDGALLTIGI